MKQADASPIWQQELLIRRSRELTCSTLASWKLVACHHGVHEALREGRRSGQRLPSEGHLPHAPSVFHIDVERPIRVAARRLCHCQAIWHLARCVIFIVGMKQHLHVEEQLRQRAACGPNLRVCQPKTHPASFVNLHVERTVGIFHEDVWSGCSGFCSSASRCGQVDPQLVHSSVV